MKRICWVLLYILVYNLTSCLVWSLNFFAWILTCSEKITCSASGYQNGMIFNLLKKLPMYSTTVYFLHKICSQELTLYSSIYGNLFLDEFFYKKYLGIPIKIQKKHIFGHICTLWLDYKKTKKQKTTGFIIASCSAISNKSINKILTF